jgi:hypothetical protein
MGRAKVASSQSESGLPHRVVRPHRQARLPASGRGLEKETLTVDVSSTMLAPFSFRKTRFGKLGRFMQRLVSVCRVAFVAVLVSLSGCGSAGSKSGNAGGAHPDGGSPVSGASGGSPSQSLTCGMVCSGTWTCKADSQRSFTARPDRDGCGLFTGETLSLRLECDGTFVGASECSGSDQCVSAQSTWKGTGSAIKLTVTAAGVSVSESCVRGGDESVPVPSASCWSIDPGTAQCALGTQSIADSCSSRSHSIYCSDGTSYVFECAGDSTGCYCHCLTGTTEFQRCEYNPVVCGSPQQPCLTDSASCGFPALPTARPPACVVDRDCPTVIPRCNQISRTCEPAPTAASSGCWRDGDNDSTPSAACSFQTQRVGCDDGKLYEVSCSGAGPSCICTCAVDKVPISTCEYADHSTPCRTSLADCGFPAAASAATSTMSCLTAAACPSSLPSCLAGSCASRNAP